jgi:hypothetical protein
MADAVVPDEDGGDCDEGILPYRHLALRVLARALRDLSEAATSADRDSARSFLTGSAMLTHWCQVAEIDPHMVSRHVARFTG